MRHSKRALRVQMKRPRARFIPTIVRVRTMRWIKRGRLTVAPEGFEPSRPRGLRILNPLRLPFRQEAMGATLDEKG